MNQHLCLKIARRMNTLLGEALGEGVVPRRMLDDPLYARDVLMVCDSMDGEELPKLARLFRQALLERDAVPPQREPLSISSMLNSIFGPSQSGEETGAESATKPAPRRWFGRSRRAEAATPDSRPAAPGADPH